MSDQDAGAQRCETPGQAVSNDAAAAQPVVAWIDADQQSRLRVFGKAYVHTTDHALPGSTALYAAPATLKRDAQFRAGIIAAAARLDEEAEFACPDAQDAALTQENARVLREWAAALAADPQQVRCPTFEEQQADHFLNADPQQEPKPCPHCGSASGGVVTRRATYVCRDCGKPVNHPLDPQQTPQG